MPLRRLSAVPPPIGAYTPISAMQHWVTLNSPGGRDSNGNTLDPVAFGNTWAAIRGLTGQEQDKAQQISQAISLLVAIPFQDGINEGMTVKTSDGRELVIRYIDPVDDRKVELRLYCAQFGQNAGQQQ